MLLRSGVDIVVEVVDHETSAVGRQVDIQLEEQGDERGRYGSLGGQGDKDVSLGVDEVEEDLRGQIGTKSCSRPCCQSFYLCLWTCMTICMCVQS